MSLEYWSYSIQQDLKLCLTKRFSYNEKIMIFCFVLIVSHVFHGCFFNDASNRIYKT